MLMQVMKKKPEMILFYNANKIGVDCFDQMARLYTTRLASRRWPIAVWGNILDIAAISSYVLYKKVTNERITRRQFILMLVKTCWARQNLARAIATGSSKETVKKCVSKGSVMVSVATTRLSQLVFYAKNLLVENVHKTILE